MIKADSWIRKMAQEYKMIIPFVEKQTNEGVISFGLSSYGYDIRVGNNFKLFKRPYLSDPVSPIPVVDPKNWDPRCSYDIQAHVLQLPGHSFALASSVERFKIPRNVLTLCVGKSTYARCGIIVNVTPFEPGWEGYVTLEISNTTPLPARIYANEGIAQVLFFESDTQCETTYADRKGKYQSQIGITLPKI